MKIDTKLRKQLKNYLVQKIKEEEKREIIITTPSKLTDEQLKLFYQGVPKLKEHTVKNEVDNELLGGFVIKFGSKIIDASVRGHLRAVVSDLMSN